MVVAARNEGGSCWAAQCSGVETVEPQPFCRELLHCGRGYAAAERAELPETCVVDQDQHDIGRALRSLHWQGKLCRVAVEICPPNVAGKMKIRSRQRTRCVCRWERLFLDLRNSWACQRQNQS